MKCKLSDLSNFIMESASFDEASVENYVSTESMIADRGGITEPSALPKSGSIRRYRPGDVLISNIRPYFKKIWRATRTGTCSNDVLVIRSNGSCNPAYLYYVLSSDDFFNYMTATSKGTKMPRGDKEAIMDYEIDLPSLEQQEQFTSTMSKIDDLIWTNSKINDYLFEVCKSLFNKIRKESNGESALSTFAEVCYGKDHKELSDGTIPVFGSGGIMRYSNKALYDGEESVLIPRKGSLNNILYVSDPFWSVDTMFYTKIKRKHGGKYLYFFLRTIDMELMNAGSAVPSMTTEILNEFMIPDPGDDVLEYFDKTIQPIFDIIKNNNKTIKTLEICRQTMIKRLFTTPTTNSSD